MEPILRVENLTHTYSAGTPFQRNAIEHIDFAVYPGEYIGVIGHTGSGKSTFIQHLNGLLKPTEGKIYFSGQDIWSSPKVTHETRFHVGLVFQYPEYQLFEETVYKDISFGPMNMGLSEEEVDRRVREAAGFVGIQDALLEKSPFELSGGQKRRVAIAGVLAMEPEVLILDEPTAGLDPAGCESILSEIGQYHRAKHNTILLVSHSMEEIARNAGRIVVLDNCRILMDGTPREIFSRAEELTRIGLGVPEVTRIAMALRARGLPVDSAVYTQEELKEQLLHLKGGNAAC